MAYSNDELTTIIEENYGNDVPLPTLKTVIEYFVVRSQPVIDIVEMDGSNRRYIEQARKVSGKREARQIASGLNAKCWNF